MELQKDPLQNYLKECLGKFSSEHQIPKAIFKESIQQFWKTSKEDFSNEAFDKFMEEPYKEFLKESLEPFLKGTLKAFPTEIS